MKLNKGRRSDYRIKVCCGCERCRGVSLVPTIVWTRWRFRSIGDPVLVLTWLGFSLWFGEWEKK